MSRRIDPPGFAAELADLLRRVAALEHPQPGAWVPLDIPDGFTVRFTDTPPAYRLVGDEVQLRGQLTGTFIDGGTDFAAMPDAATPSYTEVDVPLGSTLETESSTARLTVRNDGTVTMYSGEARTWMSLDGVRYPLD